MNYKSKIAELAAAEVLTCWSCERKLTDEMVTVIDIDNMKVMYRCTCTNSGYRSFHSLRDIARNKGILSDLFDSCSVDDEDKIASFKVIYNSRVINETTRACVMCNREISGTNDVAYEGNHYCRGCYSTRFGQCAACRRVFLREEMRQRRGGHLICPECVVSRNYTTCSRCSNLVSTDEPDERSPSVPGACIYCQNAEETRQATLARTQRDMSRVRYVTDQDVDAALNDPKSEM